MKIAVTTFWDSNDNYGQLLQCYALQQYLKKLGHEPFLIRYKPEQNKKRWWQMLRKLFNLSYVLSYLKYRKECKRQQVFDSEHPRCFNEFREQYLSMTTKEYKSYRDLWTDDWSGYDALITGSDQVWSYNSENNLRAYFLDFGPFCLRRIAYAASFGRSILPEDYVVQLPSLLRRFDSIGLRERSGVELCNKAKRDDASLVCDPTLLLSGADYIHALCGDIEADSEHLMCYLLDWETLFPYEKLKEFSSKNNLEINFFPAHGVEKYNFFQQADNLTIASWLTSIATASCVVTNSFHGTVFAILLHKNFVTLPLIGDSVGMNDRINTLLDRLGLSDHIYSAESKIEDILELPIDWDKIDDNISEFRLESSTFLKHALDASNRQCLAPYKIKNVCFQTNGAVNHDYGGLDRVTEILADYLENHDINVYYLSFVHREGDDIKRQYYLPDSKNLHSRKNIKYYNEFLQNKDIDILINQEGNVDITLPGTFLKKIPAIITVLHFSPCYIGNDYFIYRIMKLNLLPDFVREILNKVVCKTFLNYLGLKYLRAKLGRNYRKHITKSDCFVLLSEKFKYDLAQFFPGKLPDNVCSINNPATFFNDTKINLFTKKKVVIYVGRLEISQKRIDRLLFIWKTISTLYPDWTLKLVGTGPDELLLKKIVAKNNIEHVIFVGKQDPKPFYDEASIFMFTSGSAEGWGMVIVEAQSRGCVPIAFDSYSSISDIIEDGESGYIVPAYDEEMYVYRMKKLMSDLAKLRKMAEMSIIKAQQFSINNIGKQWICLFNDIQRKRV